MEPGIYFDLAREDYDALDAINASALKRIARSPAAFKYAKAQPETLAQKGGTMTHAAVLEPERFKRDCVVMPNFHGGMLDENAKAAGYAGGKTAKAAWLAAHAGRTIVDAAIRTEVLGITDAVWESDAARALLQSGRSEVTLVWRDVVGNLLCKARLDHLVEKPKSRGWTIADLKKTRSTDWHEFQREVTKYRMHVQAGFYLRGLARVLEIAEDAVFGDGLDFAWVAFEGVPPHWPGVFRLDGSNRQLASDEIERMLKTVLWCERKGEWPAYTNKVRNIGPSTYYEPYKFPEEYEEEI